MGIPDNTLSDIIEKVKSWIRWGVSDHFGVSQAQLKSVESKIMCSECKNQLMDCGTECHCESCGQVLCQKCIQAASVGKSGGMRSTEDEERITKFCRYCDQNRRIDSYYRGKFENENIKSFQSDHLLRFLEAKRYDSSVSAMANNGVSSSIDDASPVSFQCSGSRSDDEDADESGKHFFSTSSECCRDNSDIDSRSSSARHEFFSVKLLGSSPLDSPSRTTSTPRSCSSVQQEQGGSPLSLSEPLHQETLVNSKRTEVEFEDNENTEYGCDDLSICRDQCDKVKQPLNFQSNGLVWLPPPPEDEEDEMDKSFFEYDDEDDDVGESSSMFTRSSFSADSFPSKGKTNVEQKEPLRAVVHGHFRALVLQLLQGEGIYVGEEDEGEGWLDIVTSLAWQAANFVKPDTKRGGSMDPGDYVKVKCMESGSPSESTLIKGVVCTKNIKHKRMTSQYKNPKLLLLGGALEYQKTPNKLASFDTLLQQEIDHLKTIVSKIEAYHPNVLLVEKSVSSYAQEYLLAKDISLVLNVKRSLLERLARCTGAHIVPSIANLSSTRLGHCEVFRLERVVEERVIANQSNKKSTKTLMFFEGCPRRLGCTVLLRGADTELLKKVKRVVQYAVFAAYHLSLETSFLADEGATLPKMPQKFPVPIPGRLMTADGDISLISNSSTSFDYMGVEDQSESLSECTMSRNSSFHANSDTFARNDGTMNSTDVENESRCLHIKSGYVSTLCSGLVDSCEENVCHHVPDADSHMAQGTCCQPQCKDWMSISRCSSLLELTESFVQEEERTGRHRSESPDNNELTRSERDDGNGVKSEYVSAVDNHQSILVSFSSHCMQKGTLCERSQLLRIKFYGSFDKPLGRYLRDELFNRAAYCRSCKEATDAHVRCYTHQQGSLTINVRRLTAVELPGEHDGKIWMWHRCLKCALINGVPPANRRVLMSDAAWGLSFGKFLELSFSNHATANRVASCGHSLQRDCLRFYGFGSMVAFFRYSPIDILSVRLPPSILEFSGKVQQEWVKVEAIKLYNEMEVLYGEVFDAVHSIEQKRLSLGHTYSETEFHDHISDLKSLLKKERNEYEGLLHPVWVDDPHYWEITSDILELNRLRRCLLMDSYIWDHRLYSLDSLLKQKASTRTIDPHMLDAATYVKLKECRDDLFFKDFNLGFSPEENSKSSTSSETPSVYFPSEGKEEPSLPILDPISNELIVDKLITNSVDVKVPVDMASPESLRSPASSLSDKIDSAWIGTGKQPAKSELANISKPDAKQTVSVGLINQIENHPLRKLKSPVRVHSFDSAMRIQEKIRQGLSPSSQLSSRRSFHASGDFTSMVRDPIPSILRTLSHASSRENQKLSSIFNSKPLFIPLASKLAGEGVRLLLPQTGHKHIVVPVYDNEPTSVVSYVLCSKVYEEWIADKADDHGGWGASENNREYDLGEYYSAASTFSAWQSFSSLDTEDILFRSHGSDDASSTISTTLSDRKQSPHFRVSFEDEYSSSAGKVKFSVVCYFGRQFDSLRKKCFPSDVDFVRSLSRCKRWNAQGGKSNVYFAKSFDERFIIKQVTKTELDSFEEFAPQYFKYLTDSLTSGSPTCLAKVLGIYQVTVKHPKGGRQTKMEFVVMENLFFKKNISRVYDLKGSTRSRYNPDTTGKNKVLLDMNLLQTLQTDPIFLNSKAKRTLERAVWNDTFFLASVDVMDYSLLVGVDDEGHELVLGIIDFMRQYTWDKHLETWVKASGILGGPKNTPPTVISPLQYKKRFRKAMSTYFLTVPDQWSA